MVELLGTPGFSAATILFTALWLGPSLPTNWAIAIPVKNLTSLR